MKFLKNFLKYFFGSLAGIIALCYIFGYDYLFKGIAKTYLRGESSATIDDGTLFPNHPIVTGTPIPWEKEANYNKKALPKSVTQDLLKTKSAAFVIIKDGKLLHEQYWKGYNAHSHTNSFSMAKTVTSILLGAAIADGKIKSENQLYSDFYPDYAQMKYGNQLTLKNLVTMEAGLDWNENYHNPFSPNARAYYGNNLADAVFSRKFKENPGTRFEYQSGATQLLGFALRKAVNKPLAEYLSEKVWKPLGMQQNAFWTTDENGMEKTFCCIYSNALDFAKLGQLFLDNGKAGNTQVISPDYLQKLITPTKESGYAYSYGMWINQDNKYHHYYFEGLQGQYIIIVPEKNIVLVRLGSNKNNIKDSKGRPLNVSLYVNEIIDHYLDS